MARNRLALLLLAVSLICSLGVVVQQPPLVYAADNTYKVDNTGDAGIAGNPPSPATLATYCLDAVSNDCSLRQAIIRANYDSGSSEINFNLFTSATPGYSAGSWTIYPQDALPALTSSNTTITGASKISLSLPTIVIDGRDVPDTNAVGLTITSSGNMIQSLAIVNFTGDSTTNGIGIYITGSGATANRIVGNSIGNKPLSSTLVPNSQAGIRLDGGASGNYIGSSSAQADRNYISGNGANGISLSSANNNYIQNNYIGVVISSGAVPAVSPNTGYGIQINNSSNNQIGGTVPNSLNVISANTLSGVYLTGSQTISNTLAGNFIGVNTEGIKATGYGNSQDGIRVVNGASNNIIDGSADANNIIGGNGGYGIFISDSNTTGNKIYNSYIGVGADMTNAANTSGGIGFRNNTSGNVVGAVGKGNIISGNTGYGISFTQTNSSFNLSESNVIEANIIGLNDSATLSAPNTSGGIFVTAGAVQTRIGSSVAGGGNVIAGNGGPGVVINGTSAISTTLQGNIIGLGKATSGANQGKYAVKIANSGDGVQINNAVGTVVGGTSAAAGNTIAGNGKNGIRISGTGTTTTTLSYNTLGTAKPSTAYLSGLGNTENGVLVDASSGPVEIRNSTIYSNTLSGVRVMGTPQRVLIKDNSFTGNGQGKTGDDAKAIALKDTTVGGSEVATKPNHDIDPPYNLALNEKRLVTGRVRIDKLSPSACITCTLQFFAADPSTLDGEGRDAIATTNVELDTSGYFTTTLATLPEQLAVTATDYQGNTSEFSVLTASPAVDIEVIGASSLLAGPSEPVTYTLRVTNVGTLDLTDLQLVAKSDKGWEPVLTPEALALKGTGQNGGVGESQPVTLTMTLPEGTDPRVRIPTTDTTYITVTSALIPEATDSTSVATEVTSKFVLKVTPRSTTGSGVTLNPPPAKPTTVPYNITLLNTGNLTGTVTIVATTSTIDGNFAEWETTLTTDTVTLTPGIAKTPAVNVAIPYEAAAGTQAKTTIVISSPLLPEPITITTTTTVAQDQRATIGYDREGEGAAGFVTSFTHEVQNIGNTAATFKLDAGSSIGSTVTFESLTQGITIADDGTFTIGTTGNRILSFAAHVTVSSRAYRGDKDIVSITLYDESGSSIGGVQDTITVTQSAMVPRVYLPMVSR